MGSHFVLYRYATASHCWTTTVISQWHPIDFQIRLVAYYVIPKLLIINYQLLIGSFRLLPHLFQICPKASFGSITNHLFQFFKSFSLGHTAGDIGNFCPISSFRIGMNDIVYFYHLSTLNSWTDVPIYNSGYSSLGAVSAASISAEASSDDGADSFAFRSTLLFLRN